jgi:hypothetical protein
MGINRTFILLPGAFAFCVAKAFGRLVARNKVVCLLGFAAIALWAAVDLTGNNSGVFELDGDAVHSTLHDWDQVYDPNTNGASGALATAFDPDTVNSTADDIFQGGGSKDTLGIQSGQWLWTGSKPQGKDDLAHSYAAAYTLSNGDLGLFVGADRYDNSGDSTIAFWFFQDATVALSNTRKQGGFTFTGVHRDGDLLLISDFTVGGSTSTIHAYEWSGDDATGSLVDKGALPAGQGYAIVNGANETSPWPFTDKGNTSGGNTFAPGEFFEGGVDLNAIYGANLPCFSTFMAETRSSQSPTATLSDFTPPHSFPLCGASIAKYCAGSGTLNAGQNTINYTFASSAGKNMVIQNTGIGALYNVTIVDSVPSGATNVVIKATAANATLAGALSASLSTLSAVTCPTGSPTGAVCANVGTIPAKNYVAWSVSLDLGSLSASNSAKIAAATVANTSPGACTAAGTVCSTSSGDQCSGSVSNTVTITKNCGIPSGYPNPDGSGTLTSAVQGTQLFNAPGGGVDPRVNFSGTITNSGDSTLSSIAVTDVPGATISIAWPTATSGQLAPGASATYSGTYVPSSISSGNGTTAGRYGFADNIFVTGAKAALGDNPAAKTSCTGITGAPAGAQSCDGKTCNICFGDSTNPDTLGGFCTVPF